MHNAAHNQSNCNRGNTIADAYCVWNYSYTFPGKLRYMDCKFVFHIKCTTKCNTLIKFIIKYIIN